MVVWLLFIILRELKDLREHRVLRGFRIENHVGDPLSGNEPAVLTYDIDVPYVGGAPQMNGSGTSIDPSFGGRHAYMVACDTQATDPLLQSHKVGGGSTGEGLGKSQ